MHRPSGFRNPMFFKASFPYARYPGVRVGWAQTLHTFTTTTTTTRCHFYLLSKQTKLPTARYLTCLEHLCKTPIFLCWPFSEEQFVSDREGFWASQFQFLWRERVCSSFVHLAKPSILHSYPYELCLAIILPKFSCPTCLVAEENSRSVESEWDLDFSTVIWSGNKKPSSPSLWFRVVEEWLHLYNHRWTYTVHRGLEVL